MTNGGRRGLDCRGIHPYPLFFETCQPLIPGVNYLLSLHMSLTAINRMESLQPAVAAATIWGFQGVPRIKSPDLLRWKQVYRKGLSSSVSSGQFPLLYYIK